MQVIRHLKKEKILIDNYYETMAMAILDFQWCSLYYWT